MIISHSESDAYVLCERRHYYAHGERIVKKVQSESLQKGILGHDLLFAFFNAMALGANFDEAQEALQEKFNETLPASSSPALVVEHHPRIFNWLNFFKPKIEKWQVLEVEVEHRIPIDEDIVYAFKPDLVIRELGRVRIVDYKFVADFYGDDMLALLPQLPRYSWGLNQLGYDVSSGYYAMFRTRKLKNPEPGDLHKLQKVEFTESRIKQAMQDVHETADRIAYMKSLPIDTWRKKARRAGSAYICKSCGYKDLCVAELNGSSGNNIRHVEYTNNTYGYEELE